MTDAIPFEDREPAIDIARRSEAAAGAEQYSDAAFVTDRPEPARRPNAKLLETLDRELKDAGAFSDSHWIISRAIARAQRNGADPSLGDSEAIRKIFEILRNVQGTSA